MYMLMSPILVIYNVCFGVDLLVYKDNEHVYVKYALMRINKKCQISIYHLGKIWISNKLGFFFYKICNSSFVSATVNYKIRQNKTVSLFSDVVSYPLCWISNASLWISPMSSTLQMTEAKVTLRMTLSWSSNS